MRIKKNWPPLLSARVSAVRVDGHEGLAAHPDRIAVRIADADGRQIMYPLFLFGKSSKLDQEFFSERERDSLHCR